MDAQVAPECRKFVARLKSAAPILCGEVANLVVDWVAPLLERLDNDEVPTEPKIFNDPVWGSILMLPAETLLLDTPLLQRLRGVRQLGLAHYVFPGAGYNRLEHVCGTVEGAQRIVMALEKSARASTSDEPVIVPLKRDLEAIRLAALLHDVGHGPFSHATEHLIAAHYQDEVDAAAKVIIDEYPDIQKVAPSEIISILTVICPSMLDVLTHARFPVSEREQLPMAIVGAAIGSPKYLSQLYLASVISGPIDADKLDYMARDNHHAGLTVGLETTRLLSQLLVVTVTPDNAPNKEIRDRASNIENQRYYDLGISRAGIGAYEQMIIGRAMLFDRLYYHQKIRTVEAMVRRLIQLSEKDNGSPYTLRQLFPIFSDETFLSVLGGVVEKEGYATPSDTTRALAKAILHRNLFCRAFAFATRFLAGLDALDDQDKDNTRSLLGREITKLAANPTAVSNIETAIAEHAQHIATAFGGIYASAATIKPTDVIVDIPSPDRVTVRGQDILVRSAAGAIELPNLYFDSEKWSRAYQANKLCGFVFCPREMIPSVNLAAKIVFAGQLRIVMEEAADRLTKTVNIHSNDILDKILGAELTTLDTVERLKRRETHFVRIRGDEITIPNSWSSDGRNVADELAEKLNKARLRGFSATQRGALLKLIEGLTSFYDMAYQGGVLKSVKIGEEPKLQNALRNHLRSREYDVDEAKHVSGGQTDLLFEQQFIIENKIHSDPIDNALDVAKNAPWQARRYAIPSSSEIIATVVGYKPATEHGHRLGRDCIDARILDDGKTLEIRLVVPIDYTNPSAAKAPKT